jgi:hypothetical protein
LAGAAVTQLPALHKRTSIALYADILVAAEPEPGALAHLPTDLLFIPRWASALLVVLLIVAALAQPSRRRRAFVWLALSAIFLLPVGMGMNEWYGMGFWFRSLS